MIRPDEIIAIFGQRGSGKTALGKELAKLFPRLVVIDLLRDWDAKADRLDCCTDSFDEASEFLSSSVGRKTFRMALQFDIDDDEETQKEKFNNFLRLLYKRGELTGENVCLLIEEVQFFCTASKAEAWLFKMATVGRHANVGMIISSQRPAQVAKVLISQSAHVFCGQLFEKNDLEYLENTIGEAAKAVPTLKKYKFVHYRQGGHRPILVDRSHFRGK